MGVPVIAPVLEFKLNPVGKLPLVTLYTMVSPVALTLVEYETFKEAAVSAPAAVTHTGIGLKSIPPGFIPFVPFVLYTIILYVPALVAGVTNVKLVLLPYVVVHNVLLMYAVIPALNPLPVTVIVSPKSMYVGTLKFCKIILKNFVHKTKLIIPIVQDKNILMFGRNVV